MKIALAQINYTIGAFEENAIVIINAIDEARKNGVDLVVFSELSICGYPPLDLLENKAFIDNCQVFLQKIVAQTKGIAAIVGAPTLNEGPKGKKLFNSAYFISDGKVEKVVHKSLLPTYDIFDEYRHFQPNDSFEIVHFKEARIALTICEDLWFEQPLLTNFGRDKLYTTDPMEKLYGLGFDFVINIAASPFAYNHQAIKSEILASNAKKYSAPIIYVNQVGAHTELIFDGASRVVDPIGKTFLQLPSFTESTVYCELEEVLTGANPVYSVEQKDQISLIHDALILGIRDYFRKMNFSKAVIGLSGGIDSAVTLVLATKALGTDKVRTLLLPSQFSSDHSVSDAVALAEILGVNYDIIAIKEIFNRYLTDLSPLFGDLPFDIAEENIQARIRGTLLMALSNKFGNILLNTTNKSEAAVGYGTLYGDMNGGLSVLGDVYKTDVYRVAAFINREKEVIPSAIIKKPPSAELRPDQKDSDSLPEYDILDKILFNYIELQRPASEIITDGFDEVIVDKVIRLVNITEYKRFQTPPILRVSSKAFGFGRRMPLVAKYQ
jgi:NAD+ synthase (glutamine-hydrolysing)